MDEKIKMSVVLELVPATDNGVCDGCIFREVFCGEIKWLGDECTEITTPTGGSMVWRIACQN